MYMNYFHRKIVKQQPTSIFFYFPMLFIWKMYFYSLLYYVVDWELHDPSGVKRLHSKSPYMTYPSPLLATTNSSPPHHFLLMPLPPTSLHFSHCLCLSCFHLHKHLTAKLNFTKQNTLFSSVIPLI